MAADDPVAPAVKKAIKAPPTTILPPTTKPAAPSAAPAAPRATKPAEAAPKAKAPAAKPTETAPTEKEPAAKVAPAKDAAGKDSEKKPTSPAEEAAVKAIEARAEAFVEAYNKHDAKALASLYSEHAEFVADEGDLLKGRAAIEERYKERFEAAPESWLVEKIDSIQLLTPSIALEEGTALSADSPEGETDTSRYVVIHFKHEGEWYIASVRDFPAEDTVSTPGDHLQELAWMVGDWVDESPDWVIRTSCKWSDDGNFLLQDYRVLIEGRTAVTGSTRIGWDPLSKQIKSWAFTSDGGHAESVWARSGDDTWISKATGVTAEGQISAATHTFRKVDRDTMAWSSYDRSVGGESTPDVEEVIIKRRAPDAKIGDSRAGEPAGEGSNKSTSTRK
jgi:uncharacterized protein (TIGR02246 family)